MNMLARVLVVMALSVPACGKQADDGGKANPAAAPAPDGDKAAAPAKPVEPAKAAAPAKRDPTASWKEFEGAGFKVMAARKPREEAHTADTVLGPQPLTMYVGYEPPGYTGAMQIAVTDLSRLKNDTRKPEEILEDGLAGVLKNIPSAKVESRAAIEGADAGLDVRARGNHPQGGPFKLRLRIFMAGRKMLLVQALFVKAGDQPLVDKFIESFTITAG